MKEAPAPPAPAGIRYRLRVCFAKTGRLRFISHLDFIRAFERAARRAGLPLAYSEGYSPAPRIAYGWPLPVGTAGLAEYLDLELTERVPPERAVQSLRAALPPGLDVREAVYINPRGSSLMVDFNAGSYLARIPSTGGDAAVEGWRRATEAVMARPRVDITREKKGPSGDRTPPKTRTLDIRPLIRRLEVRGKEGDEVLLFMDLVLSDRGSAKPDEILALLLEAGAPAPGENAGIDITRLGLRKDTVNI